MQGSALEVTHDQGPFLRAQTVIHMQSKDILPFGKKVGEHFLDQRLSRQEWCVFACHWTFPEHPKGRPKQLFEVAPLAVGRSFRQAWVRNDFIQ